MDWWIIVLAFVGILGVGCFVGFLWLVVNDNGWDDDA